MAVITHCDNIIAAYTHCENVVAIYTYCNLVWPLGPTPPGTWYVSWLPSDISGHFTLFGQSYRMEDYPGIYTWSGPRSTSGIVSGHFYDSSTGTEGHKTYMETNVLSIGYDAFGRNRHLEVISCSRCRTVGSYAFERCTSLQYVSLSRCTLIESCAFSTCSVLSYAYLPKVSRIEFAAFMWCSSLTSLYAPLCEYVEGSAFNGTGLTELDLPVCSRVGADGFAGNDFSSISLPVCEIVEGAAFGYCTNLSEVYLPACTENWGGFPGCTALERVDMPVCTYTGYSAFSGCVYLSEVSLPVCSMLGSHAFDGCVRLRSIELPAIVPDSGPSSIYGIGVSECAFRSCTILSYVDLGSCSYIGSSAFSDCTSLTTLILRYDGIVKLGGQNNPPTSVFYNTPILNCQGNVYVPVYLVDDYKNDLSWNWQYVSCAIRSISSDPGSYYVRWTPSNATGSIKMMGHTMGLSSFNGLYAWFPESFTGVLDSYFMSGAGVDYIETNVEGIESYAFTDCYSLVYATMSSCKKIGYGAFAYCSSLIRVGASMCEEVGSYAFSSCSTLSDIDYPVCSVVGSCAFSGCISLSEVNLPACEVVGYSAFQSCKSITSLDLPACKSIGNSCFMSCSRLSSISLPVCEYIGQSAFVQCYNLETIDLPVCSYIGNQIFGSYSVTKTLILRSSSVCYLSGRLTYWWDQFQGSIYVPASLVDAYKSSQIDYQTNNWSQYSARIFPIPEP